MQEPKNRMSMENQRYSNDRMKFKTIVNCMVNPRLLLAPMFLLLLVIRGISDPPSQYLVNSRNPRAEKGRL